MLFWGLVSPFFYLMIENVVSLFMSLFNDMLYFPDIILFMTAGAALAVLVTFFRYLLKGSY